MTRQARIYSYKCVDCGWVDYRAEPSEFDSCVNCGSTKSRSITKETRELHTIGMTKEIKDALRYTEWFLRPPPPELTKAEMKALMAKCVALAEAEMSYGEWGSILLKEEEE